VHSQVVGAAAECQNKLCMVLFYASISRHWTNNL